MALDYSSQAYWQGRLRSERESGFEWLISPSPILEILQGFMSIGKPTNGCLALLHFGCGSSSLGRDVQKHFGGSVAVYDADYVAPDVICGSDSTSPIPLLHVDALSLESLQSAAPPGGWNILLDKSTADAISCGPQVICEGKDRRAARRKKDAIEVLCDNLGQVITLGGHWLSISYSSSRFDFLSGLEQPAWEVVERRPVSVAPATSNVDHVVYHGPTGIWAWVLRRVR